MERSREGGRAVRHTCGRGLGGGGSAGQGVGGGLLLFALATSAPFFESVHTFPHVHDGCRLVFAYRLVQEGLWVEQRGGTPSE